jgi:hypothetical protein
MKKRPRSLMWLTLAFSWWLGACSSINGVREAHEHHVIGYGTAVAVIDAGDEAHARPYAEQYCDTLGKLAQFRRTSKHRHARYAYSNDVEIECVSPKDTR